MFSIFQDFKKLKDQNFIKIANPNLQNIFQALSLNYIIDVKMISTTFADENLKNGIIYIDRYRKNEHDVFIVCTKKILIFFEEETLYQMKSFLFQKIPIYATEEAYDSITQFFKNKNY